MINNELFFIWSAYKLNTRTVVEKITHLGKTFSTFYASFEITLLDAMRFHNHLFRFLILACSLVLWCIYVFHVHFSNRIVFPLSQRVKNFEQKLFDNFIYNKLDYCYSISLCISRFDTPSVVKFIKTCRWKVF